MPNTVEGEKNLKIPRKAVPLETLRQVVGSGLPVKGLDSLIAVSPDTLSILAKPQEKP